MIQNFISKLSAQEKKVLYIAIFFVLAALLDRLFLGPAMSRLKSLDEDIVQQENVIRGDLRFLSYKDRILKENRDFSVYYTEKAQTEEEIIAAFLKKIEMLASDAKVNLIKVSPSGTKQKKGYVEYYANLECDGRLADVAKFIYSVDTSADLLRIIQLSVNPRKAGSEDVSAALKVTKIIIDASSVQEAEELSKKLGEKETIPQDKGATPDGAEADEIKPSLWERFMEKKAPDENTGETEETVVDENATENE